MIEIEVQPLKKSEMAVPFFSLDNGRNEIDPIRMFKYLLLKSIFELSDANIVEPSKYDMSFKYFLGMASDLG